MADQKWKQTEGSWTGLKKTDWRFRIWRWFAWRILKFPFTVNFTPEDMDEVYAIGFATSKRASDRMRGDDLLIERLNQANAQIAALSGSRKGRRAMQQVARNAIRKESK